MTKQVLIAAAAPYAAVRKICFGKIVNRILSIHFYRGVNIMTNTNEMKKAWATPTLEVHGTVEQITQQNKTIGSDDGVILIVPGLTPPGGVAIGPLGS